MSRIFKISGVILVGLTLLGGLLYRSASVQDMMMQTGVAVMLNSGPEAFDGLQVVVCGSASPLGNNPDRAQACLAVVTPEHFFLVDVGARSPMRIAQAQLPMNRLTGVMLTHFHSDHIAGLADVNLASWVAGRRASMRVYGPSGVETVVAGFNQAYRLDRGYRTAHHGEALLPPSAGPMVAKTFQPGLVWQDDTMTVTSFLVDHHPIDPAVGYRFDYRGRSVVISGDTNTSDNLFAAAAGADIVFHDALARDSLDIMQNAMLESGRTTFAQIIADVTDYHADTRTLEEAATAAGIEQLVLYHLVPTPMNSLTETMFLRGLSDKTLLAHDLQVFELPPESDEVIIR
ncbi:MAG: MBL fold metallo-hydrolase [Proteobacteria bacterium]|jgi:ribonuclease Z|nr:MBL fold metallo-hydrolase [Pseudomonadota bacterium]